MKTIEIEESVARMFDIRRHLIVPNISWGLGIHECDLLVVRNSGYAIEVEIKVSKADLKKDIEKRHGHISSKIKELYFAVPSHLYAAATEFVPAHAGIIVVEIIDHSASISYRKAAIKRPATVNKNARPLTANEISTVARLGCMRIWGLKAKLIRLTPLATVAITG